MTNPEKELIYQQMTLILNEIHHLMESYESWKDRLFRLDQIQTPQKASNSKSLFSEEIENQKYLQTKKSDRRGYGYQTLALDIASLLKDCGRPLSTKEIHERLTEKGYVLNLSNLTSNILRKINDDSRINVERAYRGYWQYRLKN